MARNGGSPGDTRRRYDGRYAARDSGFQGDVPLDEFLFEPFYQLMRLRLLADEIERTGIGPGLAVADARVVVVCPKTNRDYRLAVSSTPLARRFPKHTTVEGVMQATLRDPAGISVASSEALVAGLRASDQAKNLGNWLDHHALRYGW